MRISIANPLNFLNLPHTMLPWIQHRSTSLCLLICGLGALMLFMYGFFPLKYSTGKVAHLDDLPNFIGGVSIDGHEVYYAGQNSVVLMVIDGLRYDFASDHYMPYTGELLKNKSACIYVSVTKLPTVTMPRIKAMMTGSVSTFADVALNLGAPAVRGDSVLRAAAARGSKSVFYGDSTWLELFPGLWAESFGTTPFNITDYTEVDKHVTRHLDKILAPDENGMAKFDFLVLHYLGLDHLGHSEGVRSPKIGLKLLEMDNIIKKIYTAMKKWDRTGVLFVCGDHGMQDSGGHGGATPAELLVPLVVAKNQDYVCPHPAGAGPTVAQLDMAPSVAWLLNAPIPADSTGRILPSLLPADVSKIKAFLCGPSSHMLQISTSVFLANEYCKQFERAEKQFAHYLATGQQSAAKIAKELYEESLHLMAEYIEDTTVDFDMFAIVTAIVLLDSIAIALLCITLYSHQPDIQRRVNTIHKHSSAGKVIAFLVILTIITSVMTIACFITETKSQVCSFQGLWIEAFFSIACVLTMAYFIINTGLENTKGLGPLKDLNAIDYLLIFGTLFHAWLYFGTSFIQGEHMTWHFFWNTLMVFVLIRNVVLVAVYLSKRFARSTEVLEKPELANRIKNADVSILPKWVLLIVLHRYLRTMNLTGDRWWHLPDTADWLYAPENSFYLQLHLVIGTLCTLAICLYNVRHMNNFMHIHTVMTIAATLCVIFYRIATDSLYTPFYEIKRMDAVIIVDVFWIILSLQCIVEIASYVSLSKACKINPYIETGKKFVYNKLEAKSEDYFYDKMIEGPWNLEDLKLSLARSLSYLMINNMMLIITLLMRPHNVIMVPSMYITCLLTSKCMDYTLLDTMSLRRTEIADVLSKTLVHVWIGCLFFFYQGNSNSLASVDLGSGYVGLRKYCPVRVALRIGLHAYAGPALAGAALFCDLATAATDWGQYLKSIWRATNILAFHRIYCVAMYCVIAAFFRHHLCIWSVFSPKMLYDFVATVFTLQTLLTIAEIVILTTVNSWLARMVTYKTRL